MVYHVSVYHLPHVSICVLGIFTTLTKTVSHISIYFPYFTPATHCRDRPFPRWRAKLYTCSSPQFGLQHVINTHIGIYKPNKNLEMQVTLSKTTFHKHQHHILSHLSYPITPITASVDCRGASNCFRVFGPKIRFERCTSGSVNLLKVVTWWRMGRRMFNKNGDVSDYMCISYIYHICYYTHKYIYIYYNYTLNVDIGIRIERPFYLVFIRTDGRCITLRNYMYLLESIMGRFWCCLILL